MTLQPEFKRYILLRLLVLLVFIDGGNQLCAKDKTPSTNKKVTVGRIVDAPPKLDGRLDEEIWFSVEPVTRFRQRDPNEGEPATLDTRVYFLYDDLALYVGAQMFHSNTDNIVAVVSRRDDPRNSERLIISLDTYRDHRTAYSFGITATGVRVDYYHPEDEEFNRDYSFNPVWDAKTEIGDAGWTAEIRIPFSQLRFERRDVQEWGLNINRWIPDINQDTYWIYPRKRESGWSSRFGSLNGIRDITPSRRLELFPYLAGEGRFDGDISPANPYRDGSDFFGRGGIDIKLGMGPNMNLDATVNPDFGQVEADPAEVNLSAFETFFDERRPFFSEGNQLLEGNGPGYYYSRRIGAAPHGSVDGDFVNQPDNTTILGAAKLTARRNSGLSIGALAALTDREYGQSFDSLSQQSTRTPIEPLTSYGIFRLQQEFGETTSTVGFSLTGLQRNFDKDGDLEQSLTREAYAGGTDWRLRMKGGEYELSGYAGLSHIRGSAGAILGVQQSSAHYFQRPDADHVTLDSTQTEMSGFNSGFQFRRRSGRHWLWRITSWAESPGFEINDAGRMRNTDDLGYSANLTYRELDPGPIFHNWSIQFSNFAEWNFGGERQANYNEIEIETVWKNLWRSELEIGYDRSVNSDNFTRGGPLMKTATSWSSEFSINNNFGSTTRWQLRFDYDWNELDGYNFETRGEISAPLSHRSDFSITPSFSRRLNVRQYIETLANGRAATFGSRYIFGRIDRSTIALQLRLNYAFNPDLTLQVYAEPFAASGIYDNFGELAAAREYDLLRYGQNGSTISEDPDSDGLYTVTLDGDTFSFERSDFNVLSLRSNIVLRWEWRPGSTFFLVWQQNRADGGQPGRRSNFRNLRETITADGNNFFAIKFSYWLPVI